jgi:hypothetical protein
MKRFFIAIGGALLISICGVNSAQAQSCSPVLSDGLEQCINNGVSSCQASVRECSKDDYVVTLKELWESHIKECCRKRSKKARSGCLDSTRRTLETRRSSQPLLSLFRAAKKRIRDLKRNDCYDGAYKNLF